MEMQSKSQTEQQQNTARRKEHFEKWKSISWKMRTSEKNEQQKPKQALSSRTSSNRGKAFSQSYFMPLSLQAMYSLFTRLMDNSKLIVSLTIIQRATNVPLYDLFHSNLVKEILRGVLWNAMLFCHETDSSKGVLQGKCPLGPLRKITKWRFYFFLLFDMRFSFLQSCLMTIAFHPENPPLIAGGTFNGSLCLHYLLYFERNI